MSSPTLPRSTVLSRIPSLDGLRALSIFLVVALHTLQRYNIDHHVWLGWYAVFNGASGVFIFFEISGFLITSLLLQEHEKRGTVSLRGFYLRRVFRILPPLYFYMGVVILLGIFGRLTLNRADIISGIFFFHNFASHLSMWSMEHLWSISVEEQFYLWWPLLLIFCLRRPGLAGRFAAARVPIVILIISPVARVLLGATHAHPVLHAISTKYLNFDFLMFGCLTALLQHTPRFETIYRFATRIWWLPPTVMVICSILAARYENYFNLPIGYTVNGAAIAMFLLWCTRNPESSVGRILNWKPIVRIGVLSYSVYIWQTIFLHHKNATVFGRFTWFEVFPVSWLGFFLMANFSYSVIEQPSLKLRSKVIRSFHLYTQRRSLARSKQVPST
ncbi:acyltransferase family protein [Granulicella arctica]|uniref:acyltransferase family protein n=1 Tax=Granulicella arctica TaxID=940613 RepID=UPI0021DFE7E5|nr:acyltransferase [Granulicella arctica]